MQEAREGRATTRVGNWDRPAHHQCAHIHESGERCNGSTATGKRLCHTHERYSAADPLYPIQVPLLEDPSSIRFVLSQAVSQLALGAIPPANGRAILYGCRMAFDLLKYEQAERRLQAQMEKTIAAAGRMATEPVGVSASQPGSESASQPSSESASEPGSESASQPSSESAREPGSESASQPDSESAREPDSESASEPVGEPASEPVGASASEANSELGRRPVSEPAGVPGTPERVTALSIGRSPAEAPFLPDARWRDSLQPQELVS